jgi:hypothetical protein
MIRWLAKVWRRSWKRTRRPGLSSPAPAAAVEHPLGDVVVQKRRAVAGREHVIGSARETGPAFVLAEDGGELGEERDLADGGARLRWDAVRRDAATAARELVADVDDAGGEVDVVPGEAEHLGQAHTRIRPGEEQRSVAGRAGGEETSELVLGEDALIGAQRMRPLVPLKPMERMRRDIASAEREGQDTAERTEDPLDRPRRQTPLCGAETTFTPADFQAKTQFWHPTVVPTLDALPGRRAPSLPLGVTGTEAATVGLLHR